MCGTARNIMATRAADREHRIAQEVIRSMTEALTVTDLEFRFVSKPRHGFWDIAFAGGSIMAAFAQGMVLGGLNFHRCRRIPRQDCRHPKTIANKLFGRLVSGFSRSNHI